MKLGKRLRELRIEKGVSQKTLALGVGISQSAIANYEKDLRQPSLEGLVTLAHYFNVTTDSLLGISGANSFVSQEDDPIDVIDYFFSKLMNQQYEVCYEFASKYQKTHGQKNLFFNLFRGVMTKIGWLWETGHLSAGEEHLLTGDLEKLLHQLTDQIHSDTEKKYLLTTVKGEKHTFGLLMLSHFMSSKGFGNLYLGEGVPFDDIFKVLEKKDLKEIIISISSVNYQETLISWLDQLGEYRVHVIGQGVHGIVKAYDYVTYYVSYEDYINNEMR
jgi:transcriptional regulator with XRE-family HTH domain/methylmalonyl-CoA mutase cobalamin-binding subunit